mmetsp:Transcript_33589/g.51683  ORF Transcript_33589/g.51683 Transcript_33589/m.51683 type:complete len:88 (-) Transcript_33589:809-1072(-)
MRIADVSAEITMQSPNQSPKNGSPLETMGRNILPAVLHSKEILKKPVPSHAPNLFVKGGNTFSSDLDTSSAKNETHLSVTVKETNFN